LEAEHKQILGVLQNFDLKSAKNRDELDSKLSAYFKSQSLRNFFAKSIKRNAEGEFEWQINLDTISKNIGEIMKPVLYNEVQPKINVPTLFLGGQLSEYMPQEGVMRIPDFFENHSFESIPNAGHWLHAENPKDFLAAFFNFLDSTTD
jgi:esterase